jgi:hypothetical protein
MKGKNGTTTKSRIYYLSEKNEKLDLLLEAPTQHCFGISPKYPYEASETQKTEENIEGWQINYSMRSLKTVKTPTKEELYFEDTLEKIRAKIVKRLRELKYKKAIPKGIQKLLGDDVESGFKQFYSYKKKKGSKEDDLDAPMQMYINLAHPPKEKGTKIPPPIKTKFFEPDNDEGVNPIKFRNVRGYISPFLHIKSVYFGAHGTSGNGASLQLDIAQANYSPIPDQFVPQGRITKKGSTIDHDPTNDELQEEDDDTEPKENKTSKLKALVKSKTKETPEKKTSADSKPPLKKVVATPIKKTATKEIAKKPVAKSTPKVLLKREEPPAEDISDADEDENDDD